MQSQTRKLKYHVATTLDGFLAREDDSFDCFPNDPQAEHITDYMATLQSAYDTVLMGRTTYEVGLKYGVTDPYPHLESYVFSRTMKETPNPRVRLVREDALGFVRGLKAREGKDIYLCGGGPLAKSLFAEGLIDEVLIKLNPLLLGAGKGVAPQLPRKVDLELLSTKVYRSGVVLLRYEVKR
jgi:dihydrofolate reductase